MIKTRAELKKCIRIERELAFKGKDKKGIRKINITNDHIKEILRYQLLLRKEEYHRNNKGIVHKNLEMYYCRKKNKLGNKLGFYMNPNSFAEGLLIYHHGNIIVNGYAKIGKNCALHGNNCIGNNGGDLAAPVIGDNVDIGFGAIIIGDVHIADSVKIGAGAVVVKDCNKKGATLVGVPAKEI